MPGKPQSYDIARRIGVSSCVDVAKGTHSLAGDGGEGGRDNQQRVQLAPTGARREQNTPKRQTAQPFHHHSSAELIHMVSLQTPIHIREAERERTHFARTPPPFFLCRGTRVPVRPWRRTPPGPGSSPAAPTAFFASGTPARGDNSAPRGSWSGCVAPRSTPRGKRSRFRGSGNSCTCIETQNLEKQRESGRRKVRA